MGSPFGGGMGGPRMGRLAPPPQQRSSFGGNFMGGFLMGSLMNRNRTVVVNNGGPGRGPGGPAPSSGGGCFGGCAGMLVAIVIVALLGALATTFIPSCSTSYSEQSASTVIREELPAGSVEETAYYTDADGDWIHSPSTLERGMREFFEKTGVQPYVYILKNGTTSSTSALTDAAEELYDELFTDEGHFLLVFCDDGNGSYNCGYAAGSLATQVMDSEAVGILSEQLERAYGDLSLSEEEIFSQAFSETAGLIMSAADNQQASETTRNVVIGVVAVVAVGGVVYLVAKNRKAKQEAERKRTEEILNTPLEKFGDTDIEDLADKYEDDADK